MKGRHPPPRKGRRITIRSRFVFDFECPHLQAAFIPPWESLLGRFTAGPRDSRFISRTFPLKGGQNGTPSPRAACRRSRPKSKPRFWADDIEALAKTKARFRGRAEIEGGKRENMRKEPARPQEMGKNAGQSRHPKAVALRARRAKDRG